MTRPGWRSQLARSVALDPSTGHKEERLPIQIAGLSFQGVQQISRGKL